MGLLLSGWGCSVGGELDLLERFPGQIGVLSPEEGSSSCQFQPSQTIASNLTTVSSANM